MQIKFTLDPGAYAPEKAHEADAGYDLRAIEDATVGSRYGAIDGVIFDTGVHVEIPKGYVGYVQSKSGLNVRYGIICPTGTIDSGYTGSIKVKLYSLRPDSYKICKGDKIAQLIIQPLADTELVQVDSLEETERGNNGFGSTGR
ncbi:MAG: dUTP diphosphatase [Lachnospiraceae bacterium]|nr:dUTP diphosphatase [Lachnospiraceae bacterium]